MADDELTLVILKNIQSRLASIETRLDTTNERLFTIEATMEGYGHHVVNVTRLAITTSNDVAVLNRRVTALEAR